MNFIGRWPNEILSSEDYFWTEWTVAYTQAAKEEGWELAFVTRDYGQIVQATVAPIDGLLYRETCHRVVFGRKDHHACARRLLKEHGDDWQGVIRCAMEHKVQEGL